MKRIISNAILARATGYTAGSAQQVRLGVRPDLRGVLDAEKELEATLLAKADEIRARISGDAMCGALVEMDERMKEEDRLRFINSMRDKYPEFNAMLEFCDKCEKATYPPNRILLAYMHCGDVYSERFQQWAELWRRLEELKYVESIKVLYFQEMKKHIKAENIDGQLVLSAETVLEGGEIGFKPLE